MHNQNHWIYIIEAAPPNKRKAKAAPIKRGKQHHTNEVRTGRQQRPKGERGESNTTKKGGLEDQTKIHRNAIHFCEVSKNVIHYILHFLKTKKKKKRTKRARAPPPKGGRNSTTHKGRGGGKHHNPYEVQEVGRRAVEEAAPPTCFPRKTREKKTNHPRKRGSPPGSVWAVFLCLCVLSKCFSKTTSNFWKKRKTHIFLRKCSKVAKCILLFRVRVETADKANVHHLGHKNITFFK